MTVGAGSPTAQWRLTWLTDKQTYQFAIPADAAAGGSPPVVLITAYGKGLMYLKSGSTLDAIDLTTGSTKWRIATSGSPFLPIDDDGVVINDAEHGRLVELDQEGMAVRSMAAQIAEPQTIIHGNGILNGVDPLTKGPMAVAVPSYVEAGWYGRLTLDESMAEARERLRALGVGSR